MNPSDDLSPMKDEISIDLRTLPVKSPSSDAWAAISKALDHRENRSNRSRGWLLAVAASVLIVVGGLLGQWQHRSAMTEAELARWIGYSNQLEDRLDWFASRNSVFQGDEAAVVSQLEDLIVGVDAELGTDPDDDQSIVLWQQRTLLLSDLVTAHAIANGRRHTDQSMAGLRAASFEL